MGIYKGKLYLTLMEKNKGNNVLCTVMCIGVRNKMRDNKAKWISVRGMYGGIGYNVVEGNVAIYWYSCYRE